VKCHQRLIRERQALTEPRPVVPLEECTVQPVSKEQAEQVVLRYEWLGTMNAGPVALYGLVAHGEILGVACFGTPHGNNSTKICTGDWPTIALERGACVHYAHPHAASFLIPRACKMMHDDFGYKVFCAYSDPEAGEIGTVYQACNWLYLGQSPGRSSKTRAFGTYLPTGKQYNSRQLRSMAKKGAIQSPWNKLRTDPDWSFRNKPDSHKYVHFVGTKRERREMRESLRYQVMHYPKRGD